MSVEWNNTIKVYGKRDDLDKFKNGVAEDKESVFSFNKIDPMPEDTSEWAEGDYPGDYVWMKIHWGAWKTQYAHLSDEKDHLHYSFMTKRSFPIPIYDTLLDLYKNLDFKIFIIPDTEKEIWEFESVKGDVKKHHLIRWYKIKLNDGKYKIIKKCHDLHNDTTQVIKEEICSPESEVSISKIETSYYET